MGTSRHIFYALLMISAHIHSSYASSSTTSGSTPDSATDSTTGGSTTDSATGGSTPDSATGITTGGSTPDSTTGGSTPDNTTTVPTTLAPVASTSFPVKTPSLDGALYAFHFTVIIDGDESVAQESMFTILAVFRTYFKEVKGFYELKLDTTTIETVRRKRDTGSKTRKHLNATFTARDVYTPDTDKAKLWVEDVEGAIENATSNQNATTTFSTDQSYKTDLVQFAEDVGNLCGAVGQDICAFNQICNKTMQLCYHRCEFLKCGDHGECQVVGIDESSIQAKCQCSSDGLYDYSGDDCLTKVMNWVYILVITCSVGGGIILILAVAVICCCIRKRRAPKSDRSLLDGYSEGGHDISLQDFSQRRSLVNPRFKSGYSNMAHSNEGYQPDSYDPYFYQSDNRSWLHSPEANAAMEKQYRAEKSFKSSLSSIDTDRSYAIKRPQVSPRAVGDEQL